LEGAMSNSPNWAQIATAGVALLAVIVAIASILSVRSANRVTRALQYFERWSDTETLPFVTRTSQFLTVTTGEEDARWRAWKSMEYEDRLAVLVFINFWEELAFLYNRRLVDRYVIREYLGGLLVFYWEEGSWFIERSRRDDPRDLEQWAKAYPKIKHSLEQRDQPSWLRRMLSADTAADRMNQELESERTARQRAERRVNELEAWQTQLAEAGWWKQRRIVRSLGRS
jgi:hypothetical protein